MPTSTATPLLDSQAQVWKTRAIAKQKWLERSLESTATTPIEAAERATWIKRALRLVKQGQAEIQYQKARMDAYAQHLSVLEMTLLAAAEQKPDGAARDGETTRE